MVSKYTTCDIAINQKWNINVIYKYLVTYSANVNIKNYKEKK